MGPAEHHASHAIRALINARDRLTVFILPAYAPELNAVEFLWAHIKHSLAGVALDRLEDLGRAAQRRLPAADAAAFVREKVRGLGGVTRVDTTLFAPAERLRERLASTGWEPEPLGPDRCRLRARADNLEWAAIRLPMLGCEVQVHGPADLVAYIEQLAARATTLTRLPGAAGPGSGT